MNHVYRIVWNHVACTWQAVAESAKGFGKGHPGGRGAQSPQSAPPRFSIKPLLMALSLISAAAWAGPQGGQVVAGNATIQQTGNTTTINQGSNRAAIDWTSFSVGKTESVRFNQPSTSAITLNRVTGTESSQILGSISANGQVFILNPNGVLFGQGAQVNVGGLVASSHGMSNADFMAGNYQLSGNGSGSVINQGTITVPEGGCIALIAPIVKNTGTLNTPQGTVLLAAADAVSLKLQDGSLIGYTLDKGSLQALVDNGGLIHADGGHVVLTAKALDALAKASINHSGVIEAQTVANKNGVVELLGDMQVGEVNLSGKIDASAPNGGDGGFVETSAAKVKVAESAAITTYAPKGQTGTWLLDPTDLRIGKGGDMRGSTIAKQLETNNVTLTSGMGTQAGQGNIVVEEAISWSASTHLTLTALGEITISALIVGTGDRAGVVLNTAKDVGQYDLYNFIGEGQIVLPGTNAYFAVNGRNFVLIHTLDQLQAIKDATGERYYALANDIDASATAGWNGGAGFQPINAGQDPSYSSYFRFDGLGNVIRNLSINRPGQNYVGFISNNDGLIRDLNFTNINVIGGNFVGGLIGRNQGDTPGMATGVRNSSLTGTVQGDQFVGGLVGENNSLIYVSGVYANVTGYRAGGLVGDNQDYGDIRYALATGQVNAGGTAGGLVGRNSGTIQDSYASASVTSSSTTSNGVGGLVGWSTGGSIINTYANGKVTLSSVGSLASTGGLVGLDTGNTYIESSYYDTQTTGQNSSAGGSGKTTAQMKRIDTYAGWNIASVPLGAKITNYGAMWAMSEGGFYPDLTWMALVNASTSGNTCTGLSGCISASVDPNANKYTTAIFGSLIGNATPNSGSGTNNSVEYIRGLNLAGLSWIELQDIQHKISAQQGWVPMPSELHAVFNDRADYLLEAQKVEIGYANTIVSGDSLTALSGVVLSGWLNVASAVDLRNIPNTWTLLKPVIKAFKNLSSNPALSRALDDATATYTASDKDMLRDVLFGSGDLAVLFAGKDAKMALKITESLTKVMMVGYEDGWISDAVSAELAMRIADVTAEFLPPGPAAVFLKTSASIYDAFQGGKDIADKHNWVVTQNIMAIDEKYTILINENTRQRLIAAIQFNLNM